jgi:CBS domain-containing protein
MPNKNNSVNEFQDPLENYDPPIYDDPLEQALASDLVTAIQSNPFSSIPPETTISDAINTLNENEIACLLVEENGKLLGVFSDRDILNKVALEYSDIKDCSVRDVMTTDPVYVFDNDSASASLYVMAVSGYRHVPVVDLEHQLVGIISPQRVVRYLREHVQ